MIRTLTLILLVYTLTTVTAADFSTVLQDVVKYDYGDSREALSTLSDLMRNACEDETKLAEYEKEILAALQSEKTTFAAKQYLCKELSIFGTEESVPTLEKMLENDKQADMSRYALERIPGEKVDDALLKVMKNTSGLVKVGIINTIGERAVKSAVKDLKELVTDKDDEIAAAAVAALGKIGTDESSAVLAQVVAKSDKVRNVAVEAYLKNADSFENMGEKTKAEKIYTQLFNKQESIPAQSAALTGLVRTVEDPTKLIVNILSDQEQSPQVKAVAISMIHQCNRNMDLKAIAEIMPDQSEAAQVQILTAFRVKGDKSVHDEVRKALKNENDEISGAAIKAISVLGDKSDVKLLAQIIAESSDEKKEIAKEALARLNAKGVDEAIIAAIPQVDPAVRVEIVESIGERQMTSSVPVLLESAKDDNARVRVSALKALSQVASTDDLPKLIDLLINAESNAERREAERTVVAVSQKISEVEKQGDEIIKALGSTKDIAAKSSLMLVLGRIGDAEALPMLQDALASEDGELKRAAILALTEWPNPQPLENLKAAAKTAGESTHKVLALRGFITLIGLESNRSRSETVGLYKEALDMAENVGEKRMVLSGLSKVHSLEALELAATYLDNEDVKGEAEIAVVENGFYSRNQKTESRKQALQKVANSTSDERIKEGAMQLLNAYDE